MIKTITYLSDRQYEKQGLALNKSNKKQIENSEKKAKSKKL